jgi:hypothetical protein
MLAPECAAEQCSQEKQVPMQLFALVTHALPYCHEFMIIYLLLKFKCEYVAQIMLMSAAV